MRSDVRDKAAPIALGVFDAIGRAGFALPGLQDPRKIVDAGLDVLGVQERRKGSANNLVDWMAEMQLPAGRYKHEFALAIECENDVEGILDMRSNRFSAFAQSRFRPLALGNVEDGERLIKKLPNASLTAVAVRATGSVVPSARIISNSTSFTQPRSLSRGNAALKTSRLCGVMSSRNFFFLMSCSRE